MKRLVAVALLALALVGCASQTGPVAVPPSSQTVAPGEHAPVRVTIPAIGVDAALGSVGLASDGSMQTPEFGNAAWYRPGPVPGRPGPAVVVAHVDSQVDGPDVFFRLRELEPGDRVTVHYQDGGATTFVVTDKERAAKTTLPTARIWNDTTAPVLRLITCGGEFDAAAGSYLDNVIVYADELAR